MEQDFLSCLYDILWYFGTRGTDLTSHFVSFRNVVRRRHVFVPVKYDVFRQDVVLVQHVQDLHQCHTNYTVLQTHILQT